MDGAELLGHVMRQDPEVVFRGGWDDQKVLKGLEMSRAIEGKYDIRSVGINQLNEGMISPQCVTSLENRLLAPKAVGIKLLIIERLKNFSNPTSVNEPIK